MYFYYNLQKNHTEIIIIFRKTKFISLFLCKFATINNTNMEVKKFYRLKCLHGGLRSIERDTDGLLDEIMK